MNKAVSILFFGILTNLAWGQTIVNTNLTWSNLVYDYYYMLDYSTHFTKIGNLQVINDTVYSELLRSDTEDNLQWYNYGNLREENGSKIFYRKNSSENERLLYDFNVKPGDTVNSYDRYSDSMIPFRVDAIDSVIIEDVKRKRILLFNLFDNIPAETWISGIGSLSGMPYNYDGRTVGRDTYHLLCANYNDSLLYRKEGFTSCYASTNAKSGDFAPVGAKWYYDEMAGMFWMPYDVDYILYTSEKDTIINGQVCRKIIKRHDLDCYFRPQNEFVFSKHDSVFFYDAIMDTFQLLYNFNASKGDDWSFIYKDFSDAGLDTVNIHVDSTGYINANNQILRLLYVTYTPRRVREISHYQSIIVEKMGDLFFMFNFYPSYSFVCDGNFSRGLRCYEDSNLGSYHFPSMESCDFRHLWTDIKSNKENQIQIYPNPVNESVFISGINQVANYKIYDINGRVIMFGAVNESEIKTNDLAKGIYFLHIFDSKNNQIYYEKIIKI